MDLLDSFQFHVRLGFGMNSVLVTLNDELYVELNRENVTELLLLNIPLAFATFNYSVQRSFLLALGISVSVLFSSGDYS